MKKTILLLLSISTAFTEPVEHNYDALLNNNQANQELRLFGDHVIDANTISNDRIRLIGGNLTVDGTVRGTITLVGGDVFLHPTAIIEGKIIAIGGSVYKEDGAKISGSVIETNLKEGLVYREYEQEEIVNGDTDFNLNRRSERARANWIFPDFNALYLNRNEGLVINFMNSKWDRNGKSHFKLTTNLGYRFGPGDLVGRIGFERGFGTNNFLILFANAFKDHRTDDGYRLREAENNFAAIFARQDFMDRWDEQGASFGLGLDLSFIKVKMLWASVEQDTLPVIDMWSLFEKNRSLRPNLAIVPGKAEYIETTVASRSKSFTPFHSGYAGLINISSYFDSGLTIKPVGDNTRIFALAILNWEFSEGLVLRNRTIIGTSEGNLPIHRMFGVGGIGSVNAYPYKYQTGNQMIQTNLAMYFTPDFLDTWFHVYAFMDIGHAWDKNDYPLSDVSNHYDNMIKSAGIGMTLNPDHDGDDFELGFTISKPIDGLDVVETAVRLGFIF